MNLQPRESVIFAEDFSAMITWYQDVLGFKITKLFEGDYHYCNLENAQGIRLGIASAEEMGVVPNDRKNNSVVLQFQVPDVQKLFDYLQTKGDNITFGPSYDEKDDFWFGGFHDLEGNPFWVVDENCP